MSNTSSLYRGGVRSPPQNDSHSPSADTRCCPTQGWVRLGWCAKAAVLCSDFIGRPLSENTPPRTRKEVAWQPEKTLKNRPRCTASFEWPFYCLLLAQGCAYFVSNRIRPKPPSLLCGIFLKVNLSHLRLDSAVGTHLASRVSHHPGAFVGW